MDSNPNQYSNSRLGIHYFPDTLHYRIVDLETWVPELEKMGMKWLTLLAPIERAIPDYFIEGLRNSHIQPIPHFYLPTNRRTPVQELRLLFRSYAHWGINEITLFDRPNLNTNWVPHDWMQSNLVENFLDLFIPLAEAAVDEGLKVIFPPLEPGGGYWDLSFLQSALQGLARRCRKAVIQNLGLGVHAWHRHRSLDWGKGGPDRWTEARPYLTPPASEDHLGFRIFEWYSAIAQRELDAKLPIYILRAGALPQDSMISEGNEPDYRDHAIKCLAIAERMSSQNQYSQQDDVIADEVIACNFWLLSSQPDSIWKDQVWFWPGRDPLPVVSGFYRLAARPHLMTPDDGTVNSLLQSDGTNSDGVRMRPTPLPAAAENLDGQIIDNCLVIEESETCETQPKSIPREALSDLKKVSHQSCADPEKKISDQGSKPPTDAADLQLSGIDKTKKTQRISHYILLPLYAWGAADWDLSAIQPMLAHSHPTIGFSLNEARLAQRVTVVGGEGALSKEAYSMLQANGCYVERIMDDGTLVAS